MVSPRTGGPGSRDPWRGPGGLRPGLGSAKGLRSTSHIQRECTFSDSEEAMGRPGGIRLTGEAKTLGQGPSGQRSLAGD